VLGRVGAAAAGMAAEKVEQPADAAKDEVCFAPATSCFHVARDLTVRPVLRKQTHTVPSCSAGTVAAQMDKKDGEDAAPPKKGKQAKADENELSDEDQALKDNLDMMVERTRDVEAGIQANAIQVGAALQCVCSTGRYDERWYRVAASGDAKLSNVYSCNT
jgi:hypothetical protein